MVKKKRKTRKYAGRVPDKMDIFGRSNRFIFYVKATPKGAPFYTLKLVLKPEFRAPKANYWIGYKADDRGTYICSNRDLFLLITEPKAKEMLEKMETSLIDYLEINPPKPWAIARSIKNYELKESEKPTDPFEGA